MVDAGTGLLSSLVNVTGLLSGEEIFDVAVNSLGEVYGVTNTRLYRLNVSNGAATLVGVTGITGTNGLAFLGATLYATTNNTTNLYTIGTGTGVASSVGGWGASEPNLASAGDIAFVGSRLFVAATGLGADTRDLILEINPMTGAYIQGGPDKLGAAGVDGLKGLASDGTDLFLAADFFGGGGDIRIIKVDIGSGAFGTVISSQRWDGTGIANSFGAPGGMANAVPEPSVLMLSSLGLAVIGLSRWKRNRS